MIRNQVATKLIILLVSTSLLPILLAGIIAIRQSRLTTEQSVIQGNQNIARQVAGRIEQYMQNSLQILQALTENINRTGLEDWQKTQILRNFSIHFDHFHQLEILSLTGKTLINSEIGQPRDHDHYHSDEFQKALQGEIAKSEVFLTDDLVPTIRFYLPIKDLNKTVFILSADVDLLHLWKIAEEIQIGESGYLNIMTSDGKLFASGFGKMKIEAIQMQNYRYFAQLQNHLNSHFIVNQNEDQQSLIVSSQVPQPYGWIITVEMPVREAYALAFHLKKQLWQMVVILLILILPLGLFISRQEIIRPFRTLMSHIKRITEGDLKTQVHLPNKGEFTELANTINAMSHELDVSQQILLRQERQALLGRIASNIAHDLKHPLTNIENFARLLEQRHSDPSFREKFLKIVTHEFQRVHIFLKNLRDLSKDIPFHPARTKLNHFVDQVLESLIPELEKNHIHLKTNKIADPTVDLDEFSFQRVFSNLVLNALDAMPAGGELQITIDQRQNHNHQNQAVIEIQDNGIGIEKERLETLFHDFKTTKKTGLGLGLAISQKVVHQHKGEITVESKVGQGTKFIITLPCEKHL